MPTLHLFCLSRAENLHGHVGQRFCRNLMIVMIDWKKEKLYQPIKQVIIGAMGSLNATQRGMILFYETIEGTLPQQSKQLCGYYLMLVILGASGR